MNLPPSARLLDPPGAPSSHQIELALAQQGARNSAMAPVGHSQMLSGVKESLAGAEMGQDSQKNLASQFLLGVVANMKKMAGVRGHLEVPALGANPAEVMRNIGL